MSKDKISTQEVVEAISTQLNISKRAADDFVKTMFSVIEEALMAGESVKIKGFGTFKTQWNAARKSVNVQTGEEFVIDGYYKVNFTPELGLKDLVNEPFAHLEAVELDKANTTEHAAQEGTIEPEEFDGLRIFSEQAIEIKDILAEINALTGPIEMLEGDAIERIADDKTDEEIEEEIEEIDTFEEDEIWEEETSNERLEKNDEDTENTVIITETKIVETVFENDTEVSKTESNIIENTIEKNDIIVDSKTIITETTIENDYALAALEKNETEAVTEKEEEENKIEAEKYDNEKISNALQDAVNELETAVSEEDVSTFTESFSTSINAEELATKNTKSESTDKGNSIFENRETNIEPSKEITTQTAENAQNISATEMLKNNKSRKRIGPVLWIFIVLFVMIGAVVGTYLFSSAARCWMHYEMLNEAQRAQLNNLRISTSEWFENASSIFDKKEKTTEPMPIVEPPTKTPANDTVLTAPLTADTIKKVQVQKVEVDLETLFQQPRVYNTFIAEENVREGSRLTRIAERHLGHRDFWVYIYEANRETIKNPDQLPIGKLIRIPKVDSRLIDPNNPRCIEYARKLHDQYVKR